MLLSVLQEWIFITNMYLEWLITYIFLVNIKKTSQKDSYFGFLFIYLWQFFMQSDILR